MLFICNKCDFGYVVSFWLIVLVVLRVSVVMVSVGLIVVEVGRVVVLVMNRFGWFYE